MKLWFAIFFLLFFPFLSESHAAMPGDGTKAKGVPRTILTLYTSTANLDLAETYAHRSAEMPMNHLGLVVRYHDIERGLPDVAAMEDVRGVLLWFDPASRVPDAEAYLSWIEKVADKNIPIVSFGHSFLFEDRAGKKPDIARINKLLARLGASVRDRWVTVTYDVKITQSDPFMVGFERQLPPVITPYQGMDVVDPATKIYLAVESPAIKDKKSALIFLNDRFGYVAEGYEAFSDIVRGEAEEDNKAYRQWYLNPFEFFATAYRTHELPKPDTTTQMGKRIFYQHIDGDGWNNLSDVPAYRSKDALASEVILNEVIRKYRDLPITVGAIAADLDLAWVGRQQSQSVAKAIFAEPHVEASTHTYSHPFYWDFFAKYDPNVERQYFDHYSFGHWDDGLWQQLMKKAAGKETTPHAQCDHDEALPHSEVPGSKSIPGRYYTPRAYANHPFSIDQEICGSAAFVGQFVPKNKKINLIQWSGNVRPFEKALRMSREHGLFNLNGGDTRFDPEYPSYIWVAPIGRIVGDETQIYSSSSNENTYTGDWSQRFYGYRYLARTVFNTDTPIRVKPFNIYFHMFSGQKLASLNALQENIEIARKSDIHPIWASEYAALANGFYHADFVPLGKDRWKVTGRGKLQTIRFDHSSNKMPDYSASIGVIGHSYLGGSLYVALDESVESPEISLTIMPKVGAYLPSSQAYLIDSRWKIWEIHKNETELSFYAKGFGKGMMRFRLPEGKKAFVSADKGKVLNSKTENGIFTFVVDAPANTKTHVTIQLM